MLDPRWLRDNLEEAARRTFDLPMSKYQYYEFQAIDRPLSESDQAELRAVSSRARITATTFINEYHKIWLIAWVRYESQQLFIRAILSHPEYDRGEWKDDC